MFTHDQFIHVQILSNGSLLLDCTLVYTSPIPSKRAILWECINQIRSEVKGPSVVVGDFNAIKLPSKHRGGSQQQLGVCKVFQCWFQNSHLIDLGFVGLDSSKRNGSLLERLDRAMGNSTWCLKFVEIALFHLSIIQSDHRPVLLKLQSFTPGMGVVCPFRFEAAWLTHDSF